MTMVKNSHLAEETTLRIHQILHTMDEPYKEVFQLRIFGELSFAKIGQIFGKTESWARVTYHRADFWIVNYFYAIYYRSDKFA